MHTLRRMMVYEWLLILNSPHVSYTGPAMFVTHEACQAKLTQLVTSGLALPWECVSFEEMRRH